MDATETFDVVILGFDERDEAPEARLQRAFGIEPATAQQLLSRLPATVQRAVSLVRAEYFRRALSLIGAQAEIRDQGGARVVSEAEAAEEEAAAAATAAARAASTSYAYAEPSSSSLGESIALDTTGRAASPWQPPLAVDPMSQTLAPPGPPAHKPLPEPQTYEFGTDANVPGRGGAAVSVRAPVNPTVREATAPQLPGSAVAPRPAALVTVFDAPQPARPQPVGPNLAPARPERMSTERQFAAVDPAALHAAPARPERVSTERQFAAVDPAALSAGAPPASAALAAAPAGAAPRVPSVAPPSAPTVGAGGGAWQWNDAGSGRAAPREAVPAHRVSAAPAAAVAAVPPAAVHASPAWGAPSGVFDPPAGAPAAGPGLQAPRAPRDPSSVFDPPPAAVPAFGAPDPLSPRDPSSIFDPPPQPGAARAKRRQPAPAAAAPSPQAAPLPDFGFVSVAPPASAAHPGYELDSGASQRPVAPAAGAAAITLGDDPQPAVLQVLSQWEQPNAQSMAEPTSKRDSERTRERRPQRARARPPPPPDAVPPGEVGAGEIAGAAAVRARGPRPPARAANGQNGPAPAHGAAAARAPVPRNLAVGIPDRSRSTGHTLGNADTRTFWETIGEALTMPFTGAGPYWIGAITAWSVAIAFYGLVATYMFPLGPIVMFFANTSLLAFAGDYYRVCLWLPLTGDDKIERAPEFDPVRLLHTYIKSGLHLSLFMIVSQFPLIAWLVNAAHEGGLPEVIAMMFHPVTWLLILLPYFYWPMGIGLTALGNDFAAIWNVPAGVRAITRAPLEYTLIVGIGVLTFVVSGIALALFGSALGITGIVISGTLGFPLAISHGIQGALMGHLARSRSEIFE